jgi:hypothetical protein
MSIQIFWIETGYAGAALLAIVFALPFSSRILFHNEIGPWNSFAQAFFHAHLELFLGNACLGKHHNK